MTAMSTQPTTASHGDSRSDGLADRAGEVVRHEERRERHDDEEVEEEHPARHESGEVVERATHEGRRASGLRQCGRPLRVRERDENEHRAGDEENERREAERGRCDDPECDVERRRDLPVCDREERRSVEDAFEASELASHYLSRFRSSVKRATPEHDEQRAEDVPDDAPSGRGRTHDESDADRDEERGEHEHGDRVRLHAAPPP